MNTDDSDNIEHSPLIGVNKLNERRQGGLTCLNRAIVFIVMVVLLLCVLVTGGVYFGLQTASKRGSDGGNSPPVRVYKHAAVASDATLCSEVGARILEDEGSAVDSAIATIFCLGVVNCHSTGLGGGGFMVVHQKDNPTKPIVIDFREVAPSGAHKDMFNANSNLSLIGGLAVAVPGTLMGLVHAYNKFGNNSWSSLVQPAIEIAENGFSIQRTLAEAIEYVKDIILDKDNFPGMNQLFTKSDNTTLLKEGDLLRRPELAQMLREIAKRTPDDAVKYFYNSKFTETLVDEINKYNGNMTKEDFMNYTVREYDALVSEFGELKVLGTPAPSSGSIYMFILNILKGYPNLEQSGLTYHRIVEAFKFAYAHRSLLGDPAYNSTVYKIQQFLLEQDTADRARSLINDSTTYGPDHYWLFNTSNTSEMYYTRPTKGTSHLSVLAENGDSVAVTTSINFYFGSKVVSESSGIILNDDMDDFSQPNRSNGFRLPEGPHNYIEPWKRAQSSTSPIIMLNNSENALVIGASGGSFITTATLLSSINHLLFGYPINEAIEYRRIHHQWLPNYVEYEANFPKEYLNALTARNHHLKEVSSLAAVQGIIQDWSGSEIFAHSDSRKGGTPDGY